MFAGKIAVGQCFLNAVFHRLGSLFHLHRTQLILFEEHLDWKYPKVSQFWSDNWRNLSTYFKYPQEVRRLIYTTNTIKGFNRQLRKVTKAKAVFPTDDSLLKMPYLAMMDITKK